MRKILTLILTILMLTTTVNAESNILNPVTYPQKATRKTIQMTLDDIPLNLLAYNIAGRNYIRQEDFFGIMGRIGQKVGNATNWIETQTPYIFNPNPRKNENPILNVIIKENQKENQAICTIQLKNGKYIPIKLNYQYFTIAANQHFIKLNDIKIVQAQINKALKDYLSPKSQKQYSIIFDQKTKAISIKRIIEEVQAPIETNPDVAKKYKDQMGLLNIININRAQKKLPPYIISDKLMQIAKVRVHDMASQRKLSHKSKDGVICFDIAKSMGYSNQIYEAILYKGDQMNSFKEPSLLYGQIIREADFQKAIFLNHDGFNEIGIAIEELKDQDQYATFIVLIIGNPNL